MPERPGWDLVAGISAVEALWPGACPGRLPAQGVEGRRVMGLPSYVYVASSWRCRMQPAVCAVLAALAVFVAAGGALAWASGRAAARRSWRTYLRGAVSGACLLALTLILTIGAHP